MARYQITPVGLSVILVIAVCFSGNLLAVGFDPGLMSLDMAHGTLSVDIAMYNEGTSWLSRETADKIGEEILGSVGGYVKSIGFVSETALPEWIEENMGDGEVDIIILFGDLPDSIYPSGNAQPDGSPAELFLEDGNMFLNTGDYIFWGMDHRNQSDGLINMLDSPQLYIDLLDNPMPMSVTPVGRQYLPSLREFGSSRPFSKDRLDEYWEVEASFAEGAGNRADPVVIRSREYDGRIAIFFHHGETEEPLPRGKVISEFILNWLPTVAGPVIVVETMPANPGEQFSMAVSIERINAPQKFSFDLAFDPSVLQVVGVEGCDSEPELDNERGVIAGIHSSAQGAGVLANVKFQAVEIGSSAISIQNLRVSDLSGEETPVGIEMGTVDVYPQGSISGVVLDSPSREPIEGAMVEVYKGNFTFGLLTHSDSDGAYIIEGVPVGKFDVTASRDGYITETILDIGVEQGENTGNVDINLTSFDAASTIATLMPIAAGEPAADFVLQDIDGKQISPSDFAGKPIILHFWDSTSEHCRRQIPHLDALYRKYQNDGLVVMGVSKEMANDDVLGFARSRMSYTIILNGTKAFQKYGVTSIPCTYYVDRDGKVQHRDVGFSPDGEVKMEQRVKELLTQ